MAQLPQYLSLAISSGREEAVRHQETGEIILDGKFTTFKSRIDEIWERIDTPVGATGTSGFCCIEKCVKGRGHVLGRIRLVKKINKGKVLPENVSREINLLMIFADHVSALKWTGKRRGGARNLSILANT